jgi:hypothetical protein
MQIAGNNDLHMDHTSRTSMARERNRVSGQCTTTEMANEMKRCFRELSLTNVS